MSADRQRRITELCHAALERNASDRAAFLREACAGDQALRREVESLLKHVGASLEPISGARNRVKLNHTEGVLHRPHHSNVLDVSALMHVREILARGGVTPSLYEGRERNGE